MRRVSVPPLIFLAAASLCAALTTMGCKPPTPPLTVQEQQTVNELTQDMQTHCIDRFLIDLPKGMMLGTMQTVGQNREVVITIAGSASHDEFNTRMAQIEAEYRAKKHIDGWAYFYNVSSPSPTIRLFERLESENDLDDSSREIEGYRWSEHKVIKMVIKALDLSDPKYRNDPLAMQLRTNTHDKKALIADLLQRVRSRDTKEIPTEPGMCFDGGFLAGNAQGDYEFTADFWFSKMPDVSFSFSSNSFPYERKYLLDREGLDQLVSDSHGAVLRKGAITVPGVMQAQEWLLAGDMRQAGGAIIEGHYFKLEGNSKVGSPQTPFFDLEMENGGEIEQKFDANGKGIPTKASLTQAQALALWDAVTRTIRMRPGAI